MILNRVNQVNTFKEMAGKQLEISKCCMKRLCGFFFQKQESKMGKTNVFSKFENTPNLKNYPKTTRLKKFGNEV